MTVVRRLSAVVLSVVVVAAGSTMAAQPAVAAPAPVPYGAGAEISTDAGRVRYIVAAPEVVTFHADEYDAASPTASRPGAVIASMVRVRVTAEGVSGEVDATSSVELVYEAPDGTLAGTDVPPYAYEKGDLLISKPSTLSAGQRILGEVYFAARAGGGKVIASGAGRRQAIWGPARAAG
jgi:hypothetical protein